MTYHRGEVVVGPDVIGPSRSRPYIVINTAAHPFCTTESLVVLVTTTEREQAIPLPDAVFKDGGLPRESYASPWVLTTLKHADIHRKSGVLRSGTVEDIAHAAACYLGVVDDER